MKSLAFAAAIIVCCYYYYRHQHPAPGVAASRSATAVATAPTPALHYHSPLDAGSTRNSAGYYSTAPAEHYEISGPRSTASGRSTLEQAARQSAAKSQDAPDEP